MLYVAYFDRTYETISGASWQAVRFMYGVSNLGVGATTECQTYPSALIWCHHTQRARQHRLTKPIYRPPTYKFLELAISLLSINAVISTATYTRYLISVAYNTASDVLD